MPRLSRQTAMLGATGMALAFALTACSSTEPPSPEPTNPVPAPTGEPPSSVHTLTDSSRDLGVQLLALDESTNAVLSPWAITRAFGQVRLGAGGATAEQLDTVLSLPTTGSDEAFSWVNGSLAQWDGPLTGYSTDDPPSTPVVHTADAVFIDQSLTVDQTFIDNSAGIFSSLIKTVDFPKEGAEEINKFVAANTGGLMNSAPRPDQETVLAVLSTTFFASTWAEEFSAEDTDKGKFTLADESQIKVKMMHGTRSVRYATGPGWEAIDLPYAGDQVMRLILPAEGTDVQDVLTPQLAQDIASALDSASPREVNLTLPKWETTQDSALDDSLKTLGLTLPFTSDADLDKIAPGVLISSVLQGTTITVAEKGTVAAAHVKVYEGPGAAPEPEEQPLVLTFDRPFVYSILDTTTGAPLFLGRVDDPSA